jgi:hypothetical protein
MMRAEIIDPRKVEFTTTGLVDLSWTPWRRIWLSSREPIWTLVDADEYEYAAQWQWNVWHAGLGRHDSWMKYAKRNTGERRDTVRMHRDLHIRSNPPPSDKFLAEHVVDHLNGQTLDNRKVNRKWVTKRENAINRRMRGQAPSLEAIVLELLAGLGDRPKKSEIPF